MAGSLLTGPRRADVENGNKSHTGGIYPERAGPRRELGSDVVRSWQFLRSFLGLSSSRKSLEVLSEWSDDQKTPLCQIKTGVSVHLKAFGICGPGSSVESRFSFMRSICCNSLQTSDRGMCCVETTCHKDSTPDRTLLALSPVSVVNFRQVRNLSNPSFLSSLWYDHSQHKDVVRGSVRSVTQNKSPWRTVPSVPSLFPPWPLGSVQHEG